MRILNSLNKMGLKYKIIILNIVFILGIGFILADYSQDSVKKVDAFCCGGSATYRITRISMNPSAGNCNGSYTIGGPCRNQNSEEVRCYLSGSSICYEVKVYCGHSGQPCPPPDRQLHDTERICQSCGSTSCGSCNRSCGGGTRTCSNKCRSWTESCNTHSCCVSNQGQSCSRGTGNCRRNGTIQCNGSCSASPGSPSTEICDGRDNDCDGRTDEGGVCCGNGIVNSGEQCDDGKNGIMTDGCDDNCRNTYCGDGYLQQPNGFGFMEECDDGNTTDDDGCDSNCEYEYFADAQPDCTGVQISTDVPIASGRTELDVFCYGDGNTYANQIPAGGGLVTGGTGAAGTTTGPFPYDTDISCRIDGAVSKQTNTVHFPTFAECNPYSVSAQPSCEGITVTTDMPLAPGRTDLGVNCIGGGKTYNALIPEGGGLITEGSGNNGTATGPLEWATDYYCRVFTRTTRVIYLDSNIVTMPNYEDCFAPEVTISKVITDPTDPTQVENDEFVTYEIAYENNGNDVASNVFVEDWVGPNARYLEFVSQTAPDGVTFDGPVLTQEINDGLESYINTVVYRWNVGTVPIGGSGIITVEMQVVGDPASGTVIPNEALIRGDNFPQVGPVDPEVTIVRPDLVITKAVDYEQREVGENVNYTINYSNVGTSTARNVIVTDQFIANHSLLNYQEAQPPYDPAISDPANDVYRWSVGDVSPNDPVQSIEIPFAVNDTAQGGDVITNYGVIDADNAVEEETPPVDVTIIEPNMTIQKVVDHTEREVGQDLRYTIQYQNEGTAVARNVIVTDEFLENHSLLDYLSATPAYDESLSDPANGIYKWSVGDVAPGEPAGTIDISYKVNADAQLDDLIRNKASLVGDNNPEVETPEVEVVILAPLLEIFKSVDYTTREIGQEITYSIRYLNSGTAPARSVIVEDRITLNKEIIDFVSADPPYDGNISSVEDGVYKWTVGDVAPGEEQTISIIFTVNDTALNGDLIRDRASIDADNHDPEETPEIEVEIVAPILEINKTVNETERRPGEEVIYTITYENTGRAIARDVVIQDRFTENHDLLNLVSSVPRYSEVSSSGVYIWNIGDLSENDGPQTIILTYTIVDDAQEGDNIRNFAVVDASNAEEEETEEVVVTVIIDPYCGDGNLDPGEAYDEGEINLEKGRMQVDIVDSCGNQDGVLELVGPENIELSYVESDWIYLPVGEYTYTATTNVEHCGEPLSGTLTVEECQETTLDLDHAAPDPICGDGRVDPGEEFDDGTGNGRLIINITDECGDQDGNVFIDGPGEFIGNFNFAGEEAGPEVQVEEEPIEEPAPEDTVTCIEAGQEISTAASPEIESPVCCEGLSSIANDIYNEETSECEAVFLTGICSDCGNGTCEDHENQCNCPEDCPASETQASAGKEGSILEKYIGNIFGVNEVYAQENSYISLEPGVYNYVASPEDGCGDERSGTFTIESCTTTTLTLDYTGDTQVTPPPDVPSLTKSVNNAQRVTLSAGSTGTYTLSYANNSSSTINNVKITDPFNNQNQNYIQFVSQQAPSGVTFDQGSMTWTVGSLNAGASGSISITFRVLSSDSLPENSLEIRNDAQMTWDGGNDDSGEVIIIIPYAATTGAGTIVIILAVVLGLAAGTVYVLSKQGVITWFKR